MDRHLRALTEKRIENTIEALKKNRMDARFIPDKETLIEHLKTMLPEKATIAVGGSMTLFETGVMDLITSDRYTYIDRDGKDLTTEEEKYRRKREVFLVDYFFTGTNAITEKGQLYNVDGMGSRVAPMSFGPRNVIVIVGYNKIVTDILEASQRVKAIAAPANNLRLNTQNPCTKAGTCVDCHSDKRICCFEVVTEHQYIQDRIKVFILGEEYGY